MNSTKSIAEKLNLSKYPTKLIINKPDEMDAFDGIEYDSTINKDKYNLIFMFIFSLEEFSKQLNFVMENQLLDEKGYLFFAYPKKGNPRYEQYIDRDNFFDQVPTDEEGYVGDSGIKFARMVSLDDVFTVVGLKSEAKKTSKSSKAEKSQCVDDYLEHVEDIKNLLKQNEEILDKYNALTYGYQKDWARFVYSAKKKETQDKRFSEMEAILAEGYKSVDLYRRNKK